MSNSLQNDIDYMKALAESGATGPFRNGMVLFYAGLIFGGASLIHYGYVTKLINMPNPWFIAAVWLAAGFLMFLTIMMHIAKLKKSGPRSQLTKVVSSVWTGVGISIFAFSISTFVAGAQSERLEAAATMVAPFVLIVYGIAWWVSGLMSGQNWLKWVAFGCFLTAPGLAYLTDKPEQLLAYAAALVTFASLPGLKLMMSERA